MKIFIYGTLKSTGPNHYILQQTNAEFICECESSYGYIINQGMYPELRKKMSGGTVIGELYEVSEKYIHQLDHFEGAPDLYELAPITIPGHDNVFAYFYKGQQ